MASQASASSSDSTVTQKPRPGTINSAHPDHDSFVDVIVHALAGKTESAGEAGGRIGLAERVEDAQAEGVEERGGARDVGDKVPVRALCGQWSGGLHRRIPAKRVISV